MGIFWWVLETALLGGLTWWLVKTERRRLALLPVALTLVATCVSAWRAYDAAVINRDVYENNGWTFGAYTDLDTVDENGAQAVVFTGVYFVARKEW